MAWPPSIKINVMTFLAEEKYNQTFLGVCFLRIREKIYRVKSRTRGHSLPQI